MDETDTDFVPVDEGQKRRPAARTQRDEQPPRYNLTTPQYINDRYYDEGIEIIYKGTPNEGMEPVNASAERRVDEWLDSLPSRPMRHEDFIANAIANRPRHDMPSAPTATRHKAARVTGKETPEQDSMVEVVPPDLTRIKGPKKQMGTIVHEVPSPGSI